MDSSVNNTWVTAPLWQSRSNSWRCEPFDILKTKEFDVKHQDGDMPKCLLLWRYRVWWYDMIWWWWRYRAWWYGDGYIGLCNPKLIWLVVSTHLKNMLVKLGSSSPRIRGETKKSLSCHHLVSIVLYVDPKKCLNMFCGADPMFEKRNWFPVCECVSIGFFLIKKSRSSSCRSSKQVQNGLKKSPPRLFFNVVCHNHLKKP